MFKLQILAWLIAALKAALQCSLGYQKWVSHSSKDRLFDHQLTHTLMCVVNCFLVFLIILSVKQTLLIIFCNSICPSQLTVVKSGLFFCTGSQNILLPDIFCGVQIESLSAFVLIRIISGELFFLHSNQSKYDLLAWFKEKKMRWSCHYSKNYQEIWVSFVYMQWYAKMHWR